MRWPGKNIEVGHSVFLQIYKIQIFEISKMTHTVQQNVWMQTVLYKDTADT